MSYLLGKLYIFYQNFSLCGVFDAASLPYSVQGDVAAEAATGVLLVLGKMV